MTAATATHVVVQHASLLAHALYALAITGGIAGIFAVIGVFVWIYFREDNGRPVLPWGARMAVEREKAYTEREQERLKRDATEIKRLALDHQRSKVLAAIQADDSDTVMALGLPSGAPSTENGEWRPASPYR